MSGFGMVLMRRAKALARDASDRMAEAMIAAAEAELPRGVETGGNVTGGSAYMEGERGPEIFVPTSSGRVETMGGARRPSVNITVNVAAASGGGRPEMVKTGQQVARAVRRALDRAEA